MPLVDVKGHAGRMLRCVNHVHGSVDGIAEHEAALAGQLTTMRANAEWVAVSGLAPTVAEVPVGKRATTSGTVVPLRLYYCFLCGYSEFYVAQVTDPEKWGSPG